MHQLSYRKRPHIDIFERISHMATIKDHSVQIQTMMGQGILWIRSGSWMRGSMLETAIRDGIE